MEDWEKRTKGVTRMTGITGVGSRSSGKFHREESSEEYLQRGGTHDKSHKDSDEGGTFMAKGQKSRDPLNRPVSRS